MSSTNWMERASRRSRGLSRTPEREPTGEKRMIMIVDDNAKIIEALSSVLQSKYDVLACYSAAEVEQRFTDDIRLVILDIKMAPDDGMAIFSLLRHRSERVPIIFHTAYPGNSEIVGRMRDLASDGCLMKGDYSLVDLEEIIERALSRASLHEGSWT